MKYSILDPTGNITAIVTGDTTDAGWQQRIMDAGFRKAAADEIMADHPKVEQVGFLADDASCDGMLIMAGGEFCGNASMSAAALLAMRTGDSAVKTLKVSGAQGPVTVELEATDDSDFKGRVTMPGALEITSIMLSSFEKATAEDMMPGSKRADCLSGREIPLVIMPGIAHAIVTADCGIDAAEAERLLPQLCSNMNMDAMGMMLVEGDLSDSSLSEVKITPIVYVPGAGTLVRENSCASGTAATGCYLAYITGGPVRQTFSEPGGRLTVEVDAAGNVYIEGRVRLIERME